MDKQETPIVLIWLLSLLVGIVLGCFLTAGGIYIVCDWMPICQRLCAVGGITLFAALLLALPTSPSDDDEEDEPKMDTTVPKEGTDKA